MADPWKFKEFNPHPYSGGYDLAELYGRPKPAGRGRSYLPVAVKKNQGNISYENTRPASYGVAKPTDHASEPEPEPFDYGYGKINPHLDEDYGFFDNFWSPHVHKYDEEVEEHDWHKEVLGNNLSQGYEYYDYEYTDVQSCGFQSFDFWQSGEEIDTKHNDCEHTESHGADSHGAEGYGAGLCYQIFGVGIFDLPRAESLEA